MRFIGSSLSTLKLSRQQFGLILALLIVIAAVGSAGLIGVRAFQLYLQQGAEWETIEIKATGRDYSLRFRYPGVDRVLGTADDRWGRRNLYVPEGAVVRLQLASEDYVYTVEIPAAGVYELATPNLIFETKFAAPQTGSYELLGSQMCGYDHPGLIGELEVLETRSFNGTMSQLWDEPR